MSATWTCDLMVRDCGYHERFEREAIGSEPPDSERNMRIVEALYEEACAFGVFRAADPLEGLKTKLYLARAVNVPLPPGSDG